MASRRPRIDLKVQPSMTRVIGGIKTRFGKIKNSTIPNKQVATLLDRWVQRNFQREGGLLRTGKWAPLRHRDGRILQDTGALRLSFTPFADKKRAGIGSDISYAIYHEEGTSIIPQRRMLPDETEVGKSILRIYDKYIDSVNRNPMW